MAAVSRVWIVMPTILALLLLLVATLILSRSAPFLERVTSFLEQETPLPKRQLGFVFGSDPMFDNNPVHVNPNGPPSGVPDDGT